MSAVEQWRWVVGHEGLYEVSDLGRVRSWNGPGGKAGPLNPTPSTDGYMKVSLRRPNRDARVHALVAEAFIGPRPPRQDVRHLDGDPTNNRVTNLAYGTRSQNNKDAVGHGTHHWTAKTHCPAGHPYSPENTRVCRRGNGQTFRQCLTCRAASDMKRRRSA